MLRKLGQLLLTIFSLIGISYFCSSQTKDFRLQEILSDIPNNPEWEVAPLPAENLQEVEKRLGQTFKYLGSGQQCHAFLGSDQKTVLKFFRHNDLSLAKILPSSWWIFRKKYDPCLVFKSCKLAFEELREPSGLLYVHINKTDRRFHEVTLLDNIGVVHQIDLDRTEFLVQEYGELAVARIDAQMKKGDLKGAADSVKALFEAVEGWSRQGIHIENPAFRRNIGFCSDKVIMLDTGSICKDSSIKSPAQIKNEVKHVTRALGRWIRKKHPALAPSFEQEFLAKAYHLEESRPQKSVK